MSIRRRLFWSNIMMLVIPVLLSIGISYIILFAFTGKSEIPMERAFPKAFEVIFRFQRDRDVDRLMQGVEEINALFPDNTAYMVVLKGTALFYPTEAPDLMEGGKELLETILGSGASGTMSINNMRMLVERVGEYRIVLVDRQYRMTAMHAQRPLGAHMAILFGVTIIMILATNRTLTWIVTRRITASLNQLSDGVHQLRDGHLDYRISYGRKDEFLPVCEDFNEMAEQIQKLIIRQQRDEMSRKELLAGISHDLRTPLTSIRAYVEGLLDGVADDFQTQLRYLSIIRNKAEDIDHIVDKLFLFSKLDIEEFPFEHGRLDIGRELEAYTQSILEEYGDRGLTVTLHNGAGGVHVDADPVQLRNALTNIVENSLKYRVRDTCRIVIACQAYEDFVTVSLTDDGPGVSPEELERIFDVFYRSDPSRQNPSKGSGLGLAITSRILSRMGGSIHAETPPEGGLRIVMELPKYREEKK